MNRVDEIVILRVDSPEGGQIFASVTGSKGSSTVVLIHGTSASHYFWTPQISAYGDEFRVVAVDLRGSGQSTSTDPPERYTVSRLAADVHAVISALGADPVHLAGHSLGGAVAMELALRWPQQLQSLQIHGAWARTDEYLRRIFFDPMLGALGRGDRTFTFKYGMGLVMSPEYLESRQPPSVADVITKVFVKNPYPITDAGFSGQLLAGRGHDVIERLGGIITPTLVTVGELDANMPPRYSREVGESIRWSQFHVFRGPRASHCVNLELPDEFNEVTLEFMRGHDRDREKSGG